jgi:hypothetical protein
MNTAQEFYKKRHGHYWTPPKTAAWGFMGEPRKKRSGPGPEQIIQKAIRDYLTVIKVFHFKVNTTGIYKQSTGSYITNESAGCPDIIAIYKGRFYGIEVKSFTGRLSEKQKRFKEGIEEAGGVYLVARSVDDVMKVIS